MSGPENLNRQSTLRHFLYKILFGWWLPKRVPIAVKLALSITTLIVSGMSMLGFTILENQKTIMTEQVATMGTSISSQLADSAKEMVLSDDTLGLQTLINNLIDKNKIIGAIIISDKGVTLASGGTVPGNYTIEYQREKVKQTNQIYYFEWGWNMNSDHPHSLITFVSPIHFQDLLAGHVLVSFSKNSMDQALNESRQVILMVTFLMTVVAIFLAFVMSRHLSRPIHDLVDASKAIGEGNFNYRLSEGRNDEIGELSQSFNQMAAELLKKSQVENIFSRYVSSSVAKQVMENLDDVELGGKHVHASVLFADIVGFTGMSENLPPKEIASLLNEFFSYISTISKLYHGHIDKFIGDCAMVVFGVPEQDPEHSFHAIACAVMIQELVAKLNKERLAQGKLPVHFRIGINSGHMVAGNLGSRDRMEYTVIGDPVNLASRLAEVAGSDQIVIMDELYLQPGIRQRIIVKELGAINIRGKQQSVLTYLVEDIHADYRKDMNQHIDTFIKEYTAQ
ncbi:MAG: HAMP domain-containing protein [Gammaproteobacteria bacterium]|nr:HAMP domain-containing protein [Gammaproteobacteria bacterium]